MAGIARRAFDAPDDTIVLEHGRMRVVESGGQQVWRSELEPGWSWDTDLKQMAEGAPSCPMTHREYVVAGRIRYLMDDGTELIAGPGDVLFIEPGHRGWVVGDDTCVLVDW